MTSNNSSINVLLADKAEVNRRLIMVTQTRGREYADNSDTPNFLLMYRLCVFHILGNGQKIFRKALCAAMS
jgi:hypothetical protein